MIRLIALDLDGTLLNRDKTVSRGNRAALAAAMARGVYVTLATGRMLNSALYFGRLIGANAPLISCNGGLVQGMDEAPPIFSRTYAPALARDFLRFAIGRGWYVQWHIGREIYSTDYRPEYFDAYRTVPGFTVHAVGEAYLAYTEKVLQFVLRDFTGAYMASMLTEVETAFPGKFAVTLNAPQVADIMPCGVTKAVGLAALAAHLGITPEEVMACGDGDNDLAMLRWAGTAVVPQDGQDAAKSLATYIAPPCDEDAVADAVEKFVLCGEK